MRILRDPIVGGAGGGGGGEATWHTALPEDMRSAPALAQIKGKDWTEAGPVLVKNYLEAQKLIGVDKIAKPQKHWGDKEWSELYTALGRPEKPDGYKFGEIKLEEGLLFDETKMAKVREQFHKLGLTPKQAEGMLQYYTGILNETVVGERTQAQQSRINAETKLKQELGGDDKYRIAVDMANSLVTRFGSPELAEFFKANPNMGNNPEVVKFLHKIAGAMSEDTARGAGGGPNLVSNKTSASQEIVRLTSDKEFQEALNKRDHPGHKEAVARWQHLFTVMHPGKQDMG